MSRKPGKPFCFVRQESGQIVYKYLDTSKVWKRWPNGRWRTRRVPKGIVFMADAQVWVLEHVYGHKVSSADPMREREAKLLSLVERGATEGERAAAKQALDKLRAKRAGL